MPNISIPEGKKIDLYLASGIASGTKLSIQNIGGNPARLSVTQAGLSSDYREVDRLDSAENDAGDSGAWACSDSGTTLNVREAP